MTVAIDITLDYDVRRFNLSLSVKAGERKFITGLLFENIYIATTFVTVLYYSCALLTVAKVS